MRVPGHLIDFIVVDPGQYQTTETFYDPAISGEIIHPLEDFELAEHGVEKVIARRAAMELGAGETANLGFGICALVPRILLEEGHAGKVTWAIEQGAVGGVPLTGWKRGGSTASDERARWGVESCYSLYKTDYSKRCTGSLRAAANVIGQNQL